MPTEAQILTLAQWFSPSYPLGSFAYSHGLEQAIVEGHVTSAATLKAWLHDVVLHGSGRNDCILLRAAYAADTDAALTEVDAYARAFAASAERLSEAQVQGDAFARTTQAIWGIGGGPACYPVAVGAAAARADLPVALTAQMYLHAFVSNLVSAAVRLVPLGQTEGQATLAALTPLCLQVTEETAGCGLDDLGGTAFLSDIAAMRHETLEHRIFRS